MLTYLQVKKIFYEVALEENIPEKKMTNINAWYFNALFYYFIKVLYLSEIVLFFFYGRAFYAG